MIEDGITRKTIINGNYYVYFLRKRSSFQIQTCQKTEEDFLTVWRQDKKPESILAKCLESNDDLGEVVKHRIIYVSLIEEEAHTDCHANFRRIKKYDKDGRTSDEKYDAVTFAVSLSLY